MADFRLDCYPLGASEKPRMVAEAACAMRQLPELTVFGCDDAVPAVGAAVVEVDLLAEERAVVAVDAVPVLAVELLAVELLVPDAAMQPASVTIAATLPAPTIRRDLRAGCGLRFRDGRGLSLRSRFVGVVIGGLRSFAPLGC
jgi:hypothetical protein